jgi:transcriptional regulator with PAS, ATPase and Fis domain
MTLDDYNNIIIKNYLEKYDDNVIIVAKKLNVGKSTIYRIMKTEEFQNIYKSK